VRRGGISHCEKERMEGMGAAFEKGAAGPVFVVPFPPPERGCTPFRRSKGPGQTNGGGRGNTDRVRGPAKAGAATETPVNASSTVGVGDAK